MTIKFISFSGDCGDLPTNDNHFVFRHVEHNILFSVSRKGNAASCHFKSDKKGLRFLKRAINDFVDFCYQLFPWCEMILAIIGKDSIGRLISKCGFQKIAYNDKCLVYLRV